MRDQQASAAPLWSNALAPEVQLRFAPQGSSPECPDGWRPSRPVPVSLRPRQMTAWMAVAARRRRVRERRTRERCIQRHARRAPGHRRFRLCPFLLSTIGPVAVVALDANSRCALGLGSALKSSHPARRCRNAHEHARPDLRLSRIGRAAMVVDPVARLRITPGHGGARRWTAHRTGAPSERANRSARHALAHERKHATGS